MKNDNVVPIRPPRPETPDLDDGRDCGSAHEDASLPHLQIVHEIARVAHEAVRGYREAIGDPSVAPWQYAEPSEKALAAQIVVTLIRARWKEPQKLHEEFVEDMKLQGWVHGEVTDPAKKTHAMLVPFDQLPEQQRIEDSLFRAVTLALYPA